MVDAFVGTWKLVDTQNFDEYMKALGEWARLRAGLRSHHPLFFFFFSFFSYAPPVCPANPRPHAGVWGGGLQAEGRGGVAAAAVVV